MYLPLRHPMTGEMLRRIEFMQVPSVLSYDKVVTPVLTSGTCARSICCVLSAVIQHGG